MANPDSPTSTAPSEITALLPPSEPDFHRGNRSGRSSKPPTYSSTPHSPPLLPSRTPSLPPRPIPLRQSPYTTFRIRLIFTLLILLTLTSALTLTLMLFNVFFPRSVAPFLPAHRGGRVLPVWYAGVAVFLSIETLMVFWHPWAPTRVVLWLSIGLLGMDVVLLAGVPTLTHRESALTLLACLLAMAVVIICLVSNYLVQEANEEEDKIIINRAQSTREASRRATILFAVEERMWWSVQLGRVFKQGASFLLAASTSVVLAFITIELFIRAYDSTYPLPFKSSTYHTVHHPELSMSYDVHIMCSGPTSLRPPSNVSSSFPWLPSKDHTRKVPTVLYEAPSRLSGTEGAEWLLRMREDALVGRVCLWDRPGYGFSDASPDVEMGHTVSALQQALEKNGEDGPFILVAEGYGGLLARIFSSRNASLIQGHIYIDAETSLTYFLSPHTGSEFWHAQVPALLSPLGLQHIRPSPQPSLPSSYPPRLARLLSHSLNPLTLSTVMQEHALSHSRLSPSFTTLLRSLRKYPADLKTAVVSSSKRMKEDDRWAAGQKSLWEEVTSDAGRWKWVKFEEGEEDVREDVVLEMVWG